MWNNNKFVIIKLLFIILQRLPFHFNSHHQLSCFPIFWVLFSVIYILWLKSEASSFWCNQFCCFISFLVYFFSSSGVHLLYYIFPYNFSLYRCMVSSCVLYISQDAFNWHLFHQHSAWLCSCTHNVILAIRLTVKTGDIFTGVARSPALRWHLAIPVS